MNGAWLPLSMAIHRLREGWQDDAPLAIKMAKAMEAMMRQYSWIQKAR